MVIYRPVISDQNPRGFFVFLLILNFSQLLCILILNKNAPLLFIRKQPSNCTLHRMCSLPCVFRGQLFFQIKSEPAFPQSATGNSAMFHHVEIRRYTFKLVVIFLIF